MRYAVILAQYCLPPLFKIDGLDIAVFCMPTPVSRFLQVEVDACVMPANISRSGADFTPVGHVFD